jgi:hypothetical protein
MLQTVHQGKGLGFQVWVQAAAADHQHLQVTSRCSAGMSGAMVVLL